MSGVECQHAKQAEFPAHDARALPPSTPLCTPENGTVSIALDEANPLAGAHVYMKQCALCHGIPSKDHTAIAKGEFPRPPHLFRGKGVTDDELGETYWKVANSIRFTGCPAPISSF